MIDACRNRPLAKQNDLKSMKPDGVKPRLRDSSRQALHRGRSLSVSVVVQCSPMLTVWQGGA